MTRKAAASQNGCGRSGQVRGPGGSVSAPAVLVLPRVRSASADHFGRCQL